MRMMNGTLVSVAAGLALALAVLPSVSRAAIVETIVEPSTDATLGSITFPAFTGALIAIAIGMGRFRLRP